MIGGRSVLGVITARGGSRGLPGKNLRPLAGRPLIAWTIAAGQASSLIDRLILSTDDDAIMDVARDAGCEVPFRRAPALADDHATSIDVVLDAADRVPGYEIVVLLQPTSPLRTATDIDDTLELMRSKGCSSALSVCEAACHPWLIFERDAQARIRPFVTRADGTGARRQDFPPAYQVNGAVYAADLAWLRQERAFFRAGETVAFEMPAERSVDIDTLEDFQAAERAHGSRG